MREPRVTSIVGDSIFTIHDLFSPEECDELVQNAEAVGFGAAPITTSRGFPMNAGAQQHPRDAGRPASRPVRSGSASSPGYPSASRIIERWG